MTRFLILAATLATLPVSAHAQAQAYVSFDNDAYLSAMRCIAYADAAPLQSDSPNVTALREAVGRQMRSLSVRRTARGNTSLIQREISRADSPAAIAELREKRDRFCHAHVQNGLVQNPSAPTS